MRLKALHIAALGLPLLMAGCIKNDLPYPRIQQNILSIAAEGESSAATISQDDLLVVLHLDETVNPRRVRFTDFTYTEGAECSKNLLEGTYDLTQPLQVTLSLYQNYTWTISAEQTIERYLTVAGQIGETAIDVPGKRVVLYVPATTDLHKVTINSIKLGPRGLTTLSPDIKAGDVIDASSPVRIKVSYFDVEETWTLYVDTTDALVTTTQADAWVNVLWVYGNAPENADNGFQYRPASSAEWITVPKSSIVFNGGSFSACIPHLSPLTEYVVRAYSDENMGNEIEVRTSAGLDLPNAGFENWWLNGKVWCPWAEGAEPWWDTGNKGAATLGQSNVTPSEYTPSGTGLSAKLETKFVGIAGIGKLAAGSIYAGHLREGGRHQRHPRFRPPVGCPAHQAERLLQLHHLPHKLRLRGVQASHGQARLMPYMDGAHRYGRSLPDSHQSQEQAAFQPGRPRCDSLRAVRARRQY